MKTKNNQGGIMLHIYVTIQIYGQIVYRYMGKVAKGKENFYRTYYRGQQVRFEETFKGDKIVEQVQGNIV